MWERITRMPSIAPSPGSCCQGLGGVMLPGFALYNVQKGNTDYLLLRHTAFNGRSIFG